MSTSKKDPTFMSTCRMSTFPNLMWTVYTNVDMTTPRSEVLPTLRRSPRLWRPTHLSGRLEGYIALPSRCPTTCWRAGGSIYLGVHYPTMGRLRSLDLMLWCVGTLRGHKVSAQDRPLRTYEPRLPCVLLFCLGALVLPPLCGLDR